MEGGGISKPSRPLGQRDNPVGVGKTKSWWPDLNAGCPLLPGDTVTHAGAGLDGTRVRTYTADLYSSNMMMSDYGPFGGTIYDDDNTFEWVGTPWGLGIDFNGNTTAHTGIAMSMGSWPRLDGNGNFLIAVLAQWDGDTTDQQALFSISANTPGNDSADAASGIRLRVTSTDPAGLQVWAHKPTTAYHEDKGSPSALQIINDGDWFQAFLWYNGTSGDTRMTGAVYNYTSQEYAEAQFTTGSTWSSSSFTPRWTSNFPMWAFGNGHLQATPYGNDRFTSVGVSCNVWSGATVFIPTVEQLIWDPFAPYRMTPYDYVNPPATTSGVGGWGILPG